MLVGLLLGLAGAFFIEYLDQTIKSSADIERVLGVPLLGAIPHDPKLTRGGEGRSSQSTTSIPTNRRWNRTVRSAPT